MMDAAMLKLDDALAAYRLARSEGTAQRLAGAAEAVLQSWDFDRGIPKP